MAETPFSVFLPQLCILDNTFGGFLNTNIKNANIFRKRTLTIDQ